MTARACASLLLTGATGFLGRHFLEAQALQLPAGRSVLALVRSADAWKSASWTADFPNVSLIEGALSRDAAWMADPRLTGVDTIVHLAAHVEHSRWSATTSFELNVGGTAALTELAGRLGARMIFVSTSGTVACFRSRDAIADESSPYCESRIASWPYYASKLAAERAARELARAAGSELVIVRPPILLGPRDHRLRSSAHVLRVLDHRLPFRLPGGMAFVDVRDVARALVRLTTIEKPRPLYHLPGHNWTLDHFFECVATIAQCELPRRRVPAFALRALARLSPETLARLGLPDPVILEMATCFWSVASLHAEADLDHRIRPAEETLRDTIAWLRARPRDSVHT